MVESKQKYQPLKLDPNLAARKSKDATLKWNDAIQSDPCSVAVETIQKDRTEADQFPLLEPYSISAFSSRVSES